MEWVTGDWVEKTVRRVSIRSAEPEERRRAYGVRDAGFWNPTPGRTREPNKPFKCRGDQTVGLYLSAHCVTTAAASSSNSAAAAR